MTDDFDDDFEDEPTGVLDPALLAADIDHMAETVASLYAMAHAQQRVLAAFPIAEIGALMRAVQALAKRLDALEARLA